MNNIKVDVYRVLDAAVETKDSTIYFTTYKFFEQRGDLAANTLDNQKFHAHFNKLFAQQAAS